MDEERMDDIIIEMGDLVLGAAYEGYGRNFNVGIWDGKNFNGVRHKFGDHFMDGELHWDDEERGTFQPYKRLT